MANAQIQPILYFHSIMSFMQEILDEIYIKLNYKKQDMKDQCYKFIKGPNNKIAVAGFGSYGQVKIAKNVQTGQKVAIKMILDRNSKEQIDVHHKLNHPRIIRLLNYYYQKERNITYMVLEYAEGGTLYDKIKFGYGQLPKEKVKKYFKDVCKAVDYLHTLNYMHRDIKPQNILLTKDDHAKLCDFGFAAIVEYRSTLCGTYEYMAPQMIQEKPYDYKIDIWALGILLFQLIQGIAPFRGNTGQDVINQMKKNITFSNRFEKDQIDLIKKILRVNAEKRPTVTQILQHPYLKDQPEQQSQKSQPINPNNSFTASTSIKSNIPQTNNSITPSKYQYDKTEKIEKIERSQRTVVDRNERNEKNRQVNIEQLNIESVYIPKMKVQQKQKKVDKQDKQEFKHYYPEALKSKYTNNPVVGSNTSNNHGTSTQTNITPNTSIDSNSNSYKPQMHTPSFINQKTTVNPTTTTKPNYIGQGTTSLNTPGTYTGHNIHPRSTNIPNFPVYQSQPNMNPSINSINAGNLNHVNQVNNPHQMNNMGNMNFNHNANSMNYGSYGYRNN